LGKGGKEGKKREKKGSKGAVKYKEKTERRCKTQKLGDQGKSWEVD